MALLVPIAGFEFSGGWGCGEPRVGCGLERFRRLNLCCDGEAEEDVVKIQVSELRRITEAVFAQMERSGQSEVELTDDYYLSIPDDRLYGIVTPSEDSLNMGQLSIDREELTQVGRSHDSLPSHDLAHISAVLLFVATKVI